MSKSFVVSQPAGVMPNKRMLQRLGLSLSVERDSENQEAGVMEWELPRLSDNELKKLQQIIAGALAQAGLDVHRSYHQCVRGHLLLGEVCRFEYLYVDDDIVRVESVIADVNEDLTEILCHSRYCEWSQELVLLKSTPLRNRSCRALTYSTEEDVTSFRLFVPQQRLHERQLPNILAQLR